MAKIKTNFFEGILNNYKDFSCKDSTTNLAVHSELQTQCLAAIVVLLAELVDAAHKANEFDFKSS